MNWYRPSQLVVKALLFPSFFIFTIVALASDPQTDADLFEWLKPSFVASVLTPH
jgi:hypothetical protein